MKRLHCDVYGKVQNCGFRDFCWRCSRKAGVSGWAANDISDHSHIVLEAQGEETQLEKFFALNSFSLCFFVFPFIRNTHRM